MRRLVILTCVGVMWAATLSAQPSGGGSSRGSVRHSGSASKERKRATTSRSNTKARRQGGRAGRRTASRRGRHHGWHDARRSWQRRRAVTGFFRLGVYMATRPRTTTTVVVTGTTYYYAGGVYYVPSGSGYVVVAAPPGAVVYSVPTYTTVVYSGTTEYLYVNGAYYVPTTRPAEQPATTQSASSESRAGSEDPSDIPMLDDEGENYEVVASPVGATVPYLPEGAHEETVAGKRYFVSDGTYYQPFAGEGETIYMVVADPRGTA